MQNAGQHKLPPEHRVDGFPLSVYRQTIRPATRRPALATFLELGRNDYVKHQFPESIQFISYRNYGS
jgi:hypothetical protein